MSLNLRPESDLPDPLPAAQVQKALGGHTQEAKLEATIIEEYRELFPDDPRRRSSFIDAALAYLRDHVGATDAGLVVLVSATHPLNTAEKLGMERAHGFRFFPTSRLSGRLFVVSNVLTTAYVQEIDCPEVADAFARLVALGLGDRPALIADLATGEGMWCPDGAENDESASPIPLIERGRGELNTSAAVVDEIGGITAVWHGTPGRLPDVWADEDHFVIATDAEALLVDSLYPLLRQRFKSTHRVHIEYNIVDGRSDFSLTSLGPHKAGVETCVVGVDIIGSFRAAPRGWPQPITLTRSDNERTIHNGLAAAEAYRRATGCAAPLWFAFDMQQTDDGGEFVTQCQTAARQQNVDLHRCLVPNRMRPAAAA